jgi:hypothetical protein
MKRTFRVATVFTGAAACAAALTPAAQAAAVPAGGAAAVRPDATCPAMESHGLVLYYDANANPHPPACITGTGRFAIENHPYMASYCADGASGSMLINGAWHPFTVGHHNLYNVHVSSVSIHGGAPGHPCGA